MMIEAMKLLREGIIGDVLVAKAWNIQRRGTIGRGKPSDPPAGFDYDLWVGPAPMVPFQANRVHCGWHWWYDFGTGDMGNDGVHDIDYARWGLGVETHPTRVSAVGGKYFFDDDQQFPDTQQVAFEYRRGDGKPGGRQRRMLIYEQRLWSTNYPRTSTAAPSSTARRARCSSAAAAKCAVLDERNKRVDLKIALGGAGRAGPRRQFLAAVRTGAAAERRNRNRPPDARPVPPGQHRHAPGPLVPLRPGQANARWTTTKWIASSPANTARHWAAPG